MVAVEDELYQQLLKGTATLPEPTHTAAHAGWEALTMPPAKWRKDSPQNNTPMEHLQSAIDSILNLQQVLGQPHTLAPSASRIPAQAQSLPTLQLSPATCTRLDRKQSCQD